MKCYQFILLFLSTSLIDASHINDIKLNLFQPDSSIISCLAGGDVHYVRLYNEDNYTYIQSPQDGYYYYAKKNNDRIIPSSYRADKSLPFGSDIKPGVRISTEEYRSRKKEYWNDIIKRDAPTIGTINNINIFIRFADENEFSTPRSIMDEPFNKTGGPSLSHYFDEVSYSQLEVITHHFPICDMATNLSYQDQFPRSYYQPFNEQTNPNGYTDANVTIREHTLLKNAIESISSQIPLDLDVDGNNDGYVDNVTFLVSGSPDGWSDLLWPHRWSLFSFDVWINGSIVDAYNLNLATGGYFTVGTLCHEFFHSLGAPDLYHYNDTGAPISAGGWDIMDGSSDTPQYMGAWMKHKYGNWIECPEIYQLGIYPLLPLQFQETSCYKINSPNSTNEFFIIEYRNKEGIYEINTPGNDSGILVYRINGNLNGNANGPPDEVYLYRPGGTTTSNGNLTQAIFSSETGRTQINDSTDPSSFLYGGGEGGLNIQEIGFPGEIIEFVYWNVFIETNIIGIYNDNDDDGIINPGETAQIIFSSNIINAPSNAENVIGTLSSSLDWISFSPTIIDFSLLDIDGSSVQVESQITLENTDFLTSANFQLEIEADFLDNGSTINYYDIYDFDLEVTLNQSGFPIPTAEIRTSPLVIDLDNNGSKEIIFGDYNGLIHIYNIDGTDYISNVFPFNTGNQIWGSPAAGDLDNDGYLEFVVLSKNKHLYIFNYSGLILDYETDTYLIGSPSIGNLDTDPELEIVFSGYSSNNKIYAINLDGSDVDGFPIHIGEKTKAGPALADFNNNGLDDIVIGTDDNNLFLFFDNGTIAPGFPFIANDKFQTSPSIIDNGIEKIIWVGNNDNHIYAIGETGELIYSLLVDDKINSSPSFININNVIYTIFGDKSDKVYAIDINGNIPNGWPKHIDGNLEGSAVFSDLNDDNEPEIIIVSDSGTIYIFNIDGEPYNYFPIHLEFPFTGPPLITDIDLDSDFEIISGSINNLSIIDIKDFSNSNLDRYWSMYRANIERRGYFLLETNTTCDSALGDANGDSMINILDLVQIANFILELSTPLHPCASDYNQDQQVDILDLVLISNFILR